MTAADTIREALPSADHLGNCGLGRGRHFCDCGKNDRAAAFAALDALEAVAQAARHVVDGTDPDGYLNLRAALQRLDDT